MTSCIHQRCTSQADHWYYYIDDSCLSAVYHIIAVQHIVKLLKFLLLADEQRVLFHGLGLKMSSNAELKPKDEKR